MRAISEYEDATNSFLYLEIPFKSLEHCWDMQLNI